MVNIFFSSSDVLSISDNEPEVDVSAQLVLDEEATLTMVEDVYLSGSEDREASLTDERSTRESAVENPDISVIPMCHQSPPAEVALQDIPEVPHTDSVGQPLDHVPASTTLEPPECTAPSQQSLQLESMPSSSGAPEQPATDETLVGNSQKVLLNLEKAFSEITSISNLQDLVEIHSRVRVVVSVEKLMELKGTHCSVDVDGAVCNKTLQYSAKPIGTHVDLEWKCASGHYGKWESSEVLTKNRHSKVFVNDSLIAIAIVLSGNNYAKFALLCKAMNLSIISKSNFCSFQTKCALPVVRDVWSKMRQIVLEILKGYKDICLCGDGRNDSPGHSARYCVYALMEHVTKVVVDLEVIDNRETGGNSTTMEKEGLRRLLERLMTELPLDELCTDASSTIIKLVRDMKGRVFSVSAVKFITSSFFYFHRFHSVVFIRQ